ncbi:BC1872 family protein [Brevibacillus sp. NRS-1366]|uniref:BC1872 family protein n=1 Tax=Brevibacillus sp. NRS-1366 TaxID=3233899 RepID=UPI003D25305E
MTEQQIIETLAMKVMGWKKALAMDGVTPYWDTGDFCGGKWIEPVGHRDKDNIDVWNPLQNIADAWQVVGKLKEHSFTLENRFFYDVWYATFEETSAYGPIYRGKGSTAQEAICNAALKAVA